MDWHAAAGLRGLNGRPVDQRTSLCPRKHLWKGLKLCHHRVGSPSQCAYPGCRQTQPCDFFFASFGTFERREPESCNLGYHYWLFYRGLWKCEKWEFLKFLCLPTVVHAISFPKDSWIEIPETPYYADDRIGLPTRFSGWIGLRRGFTETIYLVSQ